MIIGVDFDNTVVCYDGLFHKLAVEQDLISPNVSTAKDAVRDYLRRTGQEDRWTELQGYVYGPGMVQARLFPGVLEFFDRCRRMGVEVFIISHRTRYPFLGGRHDLHQAARDFLARHGFNDPARIDLPPDHISYHETQTAKIARINETGCTHFIDDLPEVLRAPELKDGVERILFDPNDRHGDCADLRRIASWPAAEEHLLSTLAQASEHPLANRGCPECPALLARPLVSNEPPRQDIAALLASAGLPPEFQLAGLPGGGNNRVYRVDCDGASLLLKAYFHHPADPRDRLAAEFTFSRFAWDRGIRSIPRPLACDEPNHLGLYEFVEGRPLTCEDIGVHEVDQAASLFSSLNRHELDSAAAMLGVASEACFSLAEHLDCVEHRVRRLMYLAHSVCRGQQHNEDTGPIDRKAAAWIQEELAPRWYRVKDRAIYRAVAGSLLLDEPLAMEDRCLSPSDFGFHNAILAADKRLRFIDFEYAGWDDPAKTVCDFVCQPRLPVPETLANRFRDAVLADCSDAEFHLRRIELLLPVYRLKWCCIMMNEFLPVGSQRRNFACDVDDCQQRKRTQLDKAKRTLQSIEI
jgi:hypothetical protein